MGTPDRVVRAWQEFYRGYDEDPYAILARTFEEIEGYDEMVVLKDIRFESHCEHHLLPIIGVAHVAYLPNTRVVGVSMVAPGLWMPRVVMHWCSASITTATPPGCKTSSMALAIWAVIFSWICSRLG